MNKFTYENISEKIEMTLGHEDATLDEVLETFARFLKAQGFQAPSNTSYLAWTDDFIELPEAVDFDDWDDHNVHFTDAASYGGISLL